VSLSRQSITLNRLKEAFSKVRNNSNAAGVDGISPEAFGRSLQEHIRALQSEVIAGHYVPLSLRRAWLRKEGKSPRPLAIPAVRDRVLQTAVAQVLTPLFEAEFEDCSFAYRQGRSVRNAIDRIGALQRDGFRWVVDADIAQFFDSVSHDQLNVSVAKVVADKTLQRLIRLWVQTPVLENGFLISSTKGIPQGSPISPMLSNLYLDHFDEALVDANLALVRYADDFVILSKTQPQAQEALQLTEQVLRDLALGLNPLKTRVVNLDQGIDYLGWHIVGSFAVQKSRRLDNQDAAFELEPLPDSVSAEIFAREKIGRLEKISKHVRKVEQELLIDQYSAKNNPLENPALANALSGIVPQIELRPNQVEPTRTEPNDTEPTQEHAVEKTPQVLAYTSPEPMLVAVENSLDQTEEVQLGLPPAKPLQRTLYLVEQGCELGKEGETFHVRREGETILELPARAVDLITVFGNISLTTPAIQLAMRHQVSIAMLSQLGRYYGRIDAHDVSALNLQRAQVRVADDTAKTLALAKQFVTGKLANSRVVLSRYLRRRSGERYAECRVALLRIRDAMQRVKTVNDLESLRGLEGSAASDHFFIMRSLLGPQWGFTKRARQPPPDAINALLSLGYTLLYQCVAGLIQARGLNPHLGLLHTGSGTHLALASDLMEEFRAVCIDAIVLRFCMRSEVDSASFGQMRDQGFQLDRAIVKQFIRKFEERLSTPMQHPHNGELNVDLRQIIDGQVLQLVHIARINDSAAYVPCVFKG
jgi:CRISP-associated protein Cas1